MRKRRDKSKEEKIEEDKLYFLVAFVFAKRRFEIHKTDEYAERSSTELIAIGDEIRVFEANRIVELYQNKTLVMRLEFERSVTSDQMMAFKVQQLREGKGFFAPELKGTIWENPYIYGYVNLGTKLESSADAATCKQEVKVR